MLIKNCSYILTQNPKREILRNCDILIEGNRIKKIARNIPSKAEEKEEIVSGKNKVVMPGLINTHTHLGAHSLKGICDDKELFEWLSIVSREESKLSEKQVYENTLQGIKEAIRSGTTTLYDSYKFPEARIKAFKETGIRAFASSTVRKKEDLRNAMKLIKMKKPELVKPIIAAHSVYESDEETLRKVNEISKEFNLIKRIHCGETRKERYDTLKKTGKLVVEYLDSIDFLDEKSLLVHCIWITKGEIKKIAERNAKVSHNPISNMKLASGGVMPLIEMQKEKIIIGLGTDGVYSNNNLDLFEEMKVCALLHKMHRWSASAINSQDVVDIATINGAACLGMNDVGAIEEGMKADIISLEISHNLQPMNDLASNIVYCVNGNDVMDSIIDGKIAMKERELMM